MTSASRPVMLPIASPAIPHVIAIASGKGGVGKTWLAITLAHALSKCGRRILLFDGDLGLANVDIQLGLMRHRFLESTLDGAAALEDIAVAYAEGGFDVIAGRSGSGDLVARLTAEKLLTLTDAIRGISERYDHVILDLGAGVERAVRQLGRLADLCIVIATNEPTSLTDAYAFIKVSQPHRRTSGAGLGIVVNAATSASEGDQTYQTLRKTCETFLRVSPPLLGIVRRDPKVREAIRRQVSLLTRFPNCPAAEDVTGLAARLLQSPQSDGSPR
jgi:flagellar biosynthesis protein FlhG